MSLQSAISQVLNEKTEYTALNEATASRMVLNWIKEISSVDAKDAEVLLSALADHLEDPNLEDPAFAKAAKSLKEAVKHLKSRSGN